MPAPPQTSWNILLPHTVGKMLFGLFIYEAIEALLAHLPQQGRS